jgi:probable HAF family extracellular repeat protein
VGEAETISNSVIYLRAFLYRNGSMRDLGTMGRLNSSAAAINSTGQIVGYVSNTDQDLNAFLYTGSQMVDLNDYLPSNSGWLSLATADAINDAGQIAGAGTLTNGEYHAYLLSPAGIRGVMITNLVLDAGRCSFSFLTETGHAYDAQFCTQLASSNAWTTFTNVTGNGMEVRVADETATGWERYYRVVTH